MKPKWKNPNYYHEWYEKHREEHLANCKAYNMYYTPKNYKKMWQELKAKTTNPETLSLMAEMEKPHDRT